MSAPAIHSSKYGIQLIWGCFGLHSHKLRWNCAHKWYLNLRPPIWPWNSPKFPEKESKLGKILTVFILITMYLFIVIWGWRIRIEQPIFPIFDIQVNCLLKNPILWVPIQWKRTKIRWNSFYFISSPIHLSMVIWGNGIRIQ